MGWLGKSGVARREGLERAKERKTLMNGRLDVVQRVESSCVAQRTHRAK